MNQNKITDARVLKPLNPNIDLKKEKSNMPAAQRKDPYNKYNFTVELDGIAQGAFLECTGLESRTEVIRYREGTDPVSTLRALPGLHIYSNICLKRGVTDSKELAAWRKTVTDGQVQRKNGSIILRDNKNQDVARWSFREGWPCRLSGPQLNAQANDVAIEEIEICHEGLDRVL
jgi:phage tail-like protein